jgi:hypothetical protein
MLSKQIEQSDRLETLQNDMRVRGSTFNQFAQSEAAESRGRFTAHERSAVVGATPIPKYEGAPNRANDPSGIEPPLGYAIDAQEPGRNNRFRL